MRAPLEISANVLSIVASVVGMGLFNWLLAPGPSPPVQSASDFGQASKTILLISVNVTFVFLLFWGSAVVFTKMFGLMGYVTPVFPALFAMLLLVSVTGIAMCAAFDVKPLLGLPVIIGMIAIGGLGWTLAEGKRN
jgi:hypothetical protein